MIPSSLGRSAAPRRVGEAADAGQRQAREGLAPGGEGGGSHPGSHRQQQFIILAIAPSLERGAAGRAGQGLRIHLEAEANWSGSATESRRRSVLGTQRLLEFCHRHGVPKVVVLSSANTYGPSPDNNQFLSEESPLMAGHRFPTMRNLVEVDMYAQSFFWRHPEVDTVILRPCNLVGRISNHISRYLELRNTPTLAGFDPMMQVMSPEDLIAAIQLALKPGVRGIFNLSGPGPVPLSELIRRMGHRNLPVPEPLLRLSISMVSGVGLSNVPSAEVDYLKYVCMVDDRRARSELRYAPSITLDQTLTALVN
jgi:UDP-glucose 4-epimerase